MRFMMCQFNETDEKMKMTGSTARRGYEKDRTRGAYRHVVGENKGQHVGMTPQTACLLRSPRNALASQGLISVCCPTSIETPSECSKEKDCSQVSPSPIHDDRIRGICLDGPTALWPICHLNTRDLVPLLIAHAIWLGTRCGSYSTVSLVYPTISTVSPKLCLTQCPTLGCASSQLGSLHARQASVWSSHIILRCTLRYRAYPLGHPPHPSCIRSHKPDNQVPRYPPSKAEHTVDHPIQTRDRSRPFVPRSWDGRSELLSVYTCTCLPGQAARGRRDPSYK